MRKSPMLAHRFNCNYQHPLNYMQLDEKHSNRCPTKFKHTRTFIECSRTISHFKPSFAILENVTGCLKAWKNQDPDASYKERESRIPVQILMSCRGQGPALKGHIRPFIGGRCRECLLRPLQAISICGGVRGWILPEGYGLGSIAAPRDWVLGLLGSKGPEALQR